MKVRVNMVRKQIGIIIAGALMVVGSESSAKQAIAADAQSLYSANCAVCHGDDGRGDGDAAYLLQPKPRDFRAGEFRIVSTKNRVATEADLVRTITKGLPGTAMPPWPQLSKAQKQQLAKYILGLQRDQVVKDYIADGRTEAEAAKRADKNLTPGEVVNVSRPTKRASSAQAKASFVTLCARCHAEDGTGRDDPAWRTNEGYPTTSRNFKKGIFKGGRDDIELYRRIALGMPGTPMPGFDGIPEDQIWQMVDYIQSLSNPQLQEKSWITAAAITVQQVSTTPTKVNDAAWNSIKASDVNLFDLWDDPDAVREVSVRAASDGKNLALLVSWPDPQRDTLGRSTTAFSDRAALMMSTDPEPPLFTMGRPDRSVEIWQWAPAPVHAKANPAHNDIYPSVKTVWDKKRSDEGVLATATSVGNTVASNHGGGTLFRAAQFGNLTAQTDGEAPSAEGEWSNGQWRVIFHRPLHTTRTDDIDFSAGKVSIALGIWDGRLAQRNGQKSVSIWGDLLLNNGVAK
tara:strand:+ start:6408 stop:7952 length:1545 start_codon:yes stop_codon:yes gene_type:complete